MANLTPTNKKVTELPVATTVAPTDLLLVVQGGVTKQVTHDTVLTAIAGSTALAATYLTLKAAAKNPDLLIVGSITRDVNGVITTAAVIWPDGTAGTFTTTAVDTSGAVNGYSITYGSPATKTYTQPTITRDSNGAATTVPQITVA